MSSPRKPGLRIYILFGGLSLAGAVILFEITVRLVYPGFLHSLIRYKYLWPPNYTATFYPDSLTFPGVSGESRFAANTYGFRSDNDFAPDEQVIITLGGSTTECLYLDQKETWPALVESSLGKEFRPFRVFNGGKSALYSSHHITQVKHLIPEEIPVKYVLLKTGLNDFLFYLKHSADEGYDIHKQENFLLRNSATGVLALRIYLKVKTLLGGYLKNVEQDSAGHIYKTWRGHYQNNRNRFTELPDLSRLTAQFQQNLAEINRLCKERNIQLVLLTSPVMWRDDNTDYEKSLFWMGGVGDYQEGEASGYFTPAALKHGMTLINGALKEFAKQDDIPVIDLAEAIPADTSAFYDDCHFNESGAKKAAAFVYSELVKLPGFTMTVNE